MPTNTKPSGTIGDTQKTMTFQPRPFADVIGLVRCSNSVFFWLWIKTLGILQKNWTFMYVHLFFVHHGAIKHIPTTIREDKSLLPRPKMMTCFKVGWSGGVLNDGETWGKKEEVHRFISLSQWLFWGFHMSHEKNPGWLGYIGDYTTQLYGDYNKPL